MTREDINIAFKVTMIIFVVITLLIIVTRPMDISLLVNKDLQAKGIYTLNGRLDSLEAEFNGIAVLNSRLDKLEIESKKSNNHWHK